VIVAGLQRRPLADAKASPALKDTTPTLLSTPGPRVGILERIADSTGSATSLDGGFSFSTETASIEPASNDAAQPPTSIENVARTISLNFLTEDIPIH